METIFDDRLGASDDVWPVQTRSEQQRRARKLVPSLRVAARTGAWSRGAMLFGDATVQVRTRTRLIGARHPAPGSHPSGEPDGTCSALRGRTGVRCVARLVNSACIDCASRLAAIPFWPQRIARTIMR